jgi:hypothetical protein
MKNKAYNVPEEHREELMQLKPWLLELPRGLPQGDDRTRYLFDIYNEYLFTSNIFMEDNCSSCRGKVYRKVMEAIETYEQFGMYEQY